MAKSEKHKWEFRNRLRRNSFGWQSSKLAIQRIKEAVSEIKKVSRKNPVLGGEGTIIFFEKLSPAIEQVDSSSGSLGTAVNNAINTLVPIISKADAEDKLRKKWLERLWLAIEEDQIPYIEHLADYWGALCGSPECASHWSDEFIDTVKRIWSDENASYGFYNGISACLSSLYYAGRYQEIIDLLNLAPYKYWPERRWGVKALAAMGKKADALRYAEDSHGLNVNPVTIAEECETILLSSGLTEEAYRRYAIQANKKSTYLSTYRAIAKKYPGVKAEIILKDLVDSTPGEEGKWFAAAKSVGLYDEALALAKRSPCDPRTLIRASRDLTEKEPVFAFEVGVTALHWIIQGYGYEITGGDVFEAFDYTMKAAANAGMKEIVLDRVKELVTGTGQNNRFVTDVLGSRLK
jgi:hypothetical protein